MSPTSTSPTPSAAAVESPADLLSSLTSSSDAPPVGAGVVFGSTVTEKKKIIKKVRRSKKVGYAVGGEKERDKDKDVLPDPESTSVEKTTATDTTTTTAAMDIPAPGGDSSGPSPVIMSPSKSSPTVDGALDAQHKAEMFMIEKAREQAEIAKGILGKNREERKNNDNGGGWLGKMFGGGARRNSKEIIEGVEGSEKVKENKIDRGEENSAEKRGGEEKREVVEDVKVVETGREEGGLTAAPLSSSGVASIEEAMREAERSRVRREREREEEEESRRRREEREREERVRREDEDRRRKVEEERIAKEKGSPNQRFAWTIGEFREHVEEARRKGKEVEMQAMECDVTVGKLNEEILILKGRMGVKEGEEMDAVEREDYEGAHEISLVIKEINGDIEIGEEEGRKLRWRREELEGLKDARTGVMEKLRDIKGELEGVKSEMSDFVKTDGKEMEGEFKERKKRIEAEMQRLAIDEKHILRDEKNVKEEREELDCTIGEQTTEAEGLKKDAEER